jgi:hypothetical protein
MLLFNYENWDGHRVRSTQTMTEGEPCVVDLIRQAFAKTAPLPSQSFVGKYFILGKHNEWIYNTAMELAEQ